MNIFGRPSYTNR